MATNPSHLCVHWQSTHTVCNWLCCLCLQKVYEGSLKRGLTVGHALADGTLANVIPEEAWKELVCWSLLSSTALGKFAPTTQWMSPGWFAGWQVTHCPVISTPPTDNQPTAREGSEATSWLLMQYCVQKTHTEHKLAISDELIPLHWCERTMSY